MEDLGYDTHNSFLLLGSLGVFAIYYWLRVFLYLFLLVPFVLITRKGVKFAKGLRRVLFFNYLIGITIEGYFEYLIAGWLNLDKPIYHADGEILGVGIAIYSLFLCLFLFPVIWVALLFQPQKKLRQKRFLEKYGAMFEHMRPGKKVSIVYYVLYSLRRLAFCGLAFYASDFAFL